MMPGIDARDVHDARKAVAFFLPLGNTHFLRTDRAILGKVVSYIAREGQKSG
jgi:hypothetical protein